MVIVPGLRSPYVKTGRIVYFARMLDKIRLHAAGKLPAEFQPNLGETKWGVFDARCCRFLGIAYEDLKAHVLAGASDAEALAWAEANGTPRDDEAYEVWNGFMTRRGWRDNVSTLVSERAIQAGVQDKPIACMFDCIDFDEGRDPADFR